MGLVNISPLEGTVNSPKVLKTNVIARDPFARADLVRERIDGPAECRWCGQPARFRYWWENDRMGARFVVRQASPFCSVGCYRDYHHA